MTGQWARRMCKDSHIRWKERRTVPKESEANERAVNDRLWRHYYFIKPPGSSYLDDDWFLKVKEYKYFFCLFYVTHKMSDISI